MALRAFHSIDVVPYSDLLRSLHGGRDHKGGPIWPNWSEQSEARFNRAGKPTDDQPDQPASVVHLKGSDWAWGGPITSHFGHWISDYSTRIVETITLNPEAILVFSSEHDRLVKSFSESPIWFQNALAWYGVGQSQTHFVSDPTCFEVLSVAPQAEQQGIGPTVAYLDMLDSISRRRLGKKNRSGVVYVSRAGVAGGLAGEIEFESFLAESGIEIFRPETAPLAKQLEVYASASVLIFSEGSALHGTQLLGRDLGDVHVICRRRGFRLAECSLLPRARLLRYHDCVQGLVYGFTEAGGVAAAIGISVPDYAKLHAELLDAGLPIKSNFDRARFAEAVERDVVEWLRKEAGRPSTRRDDSRESIYRTLAGSGFGNLVEVAKALFGETSIQPADSKANIMSSVEQSAPVTNFRSRPSIIQDILNLFQSPSYLEIGVQQGHTFNALKCSRKVAVDPKFMFDFKVLAGDSVEFHEIESDQYFSSSDEKFDVIFLDGLHTFEQTLRDFQNAVGRLKKNGVIILDDVIPNSYHASLRSHASCVRVRQHIGSTDRAWMGDVYKLVFFIQSFCQQFSYATASDSHGVAIVWQSVRQKEQLANRLVSQIGDLAFDEMVQAMGSFNARPSREIISMVSASIR